MGFILPYYNYRKKVGKQWKTTSFSIKVWPQTLGLPGLDGQNHTQNLLSFLTSVTCYPWSYTGLTKNIGFIWIYMDLWHWHKRHVNCPQNFGSSLFSRCPWCPVTHEADVCIVMHSEDLKAFFDANGAIRSPGCLGASKRFSRCYIFFKNWMVNPLFYIMLYIDKIRTKIGKVISHHHWWIDFSLASYV